MHCRYHLDDWWRIAVVFARSTGSVNIVWLSSILALFNPPVCLCGTCIFYALTKNVAALSWWMDDYSRRWYCYARNTRIVWHWPLMCIGLNSLIIVETIIRHNRRARKPLSLHMCVYFSSPYQCILLWPRQNTSARHLFRYIDCCTVSSLCTKRLRWPIHGRLVVEHWTWLAGPHYGEYWTQLRLFLWLTIRPCGDWRSRNFLLDILDCSKRLCLNIWEWDVMFLFCWFLVSS